MNPKQIIDLAKKACHPHEKSIFASPWGEQWVLRFAESLLAADRERLSYDGIHTCHNECPRPACVAVREAVQREREACAELALQGTGEAVQTRTLEILQSERQRIAAAIRARGEK